MVGHVGRADRAEIDRVVIPDLVAPVGGHHQAGRLVIIRAPIEMIEGELESAVAPRQRGERLDAGRHDLLANSVAGDDRDSIALHGELPLRKLAPCLLHRSRMNFKGTAEAPPAFDYNSG